MPHRFNTLSIYRGGLKKLNILFQEDISANKDWKGLAIRKTIGIICGLTLILL
jgi:hypothetical protein